MATADAADSPFARLWKTATFHGTAELQVEVAKTEAAIATARGKLEAAQSQHPHGTQAWWDACDALTKYDCRTAIVQERMLKFARPPYELYGTGGLGLGMIVVPRIMQVVRGVKAGGAMGTTPRDTGGVALMMTSYAVAAAAHSRKQRDAMVAVSDVLDSIREEDGVA